MTKQGTQIPVIAVSASLFKEDKERIESAGMQGFLLKPFKINDLLALIGEVLGVEYTQEEQLQLIPETLGEKQFNVATELMKVSPEIISKLQNAIQTADFYTIVDLLKQMNAEQSPLSGYLQTLANNFDYSQIQQILNNREGEQ